MYFNPVYKSQLKHFGTNHVTLLKDYIQYYMHKHVIIIHNVYQNLSNEVTKKVHINDSLDGMQNTQNTNM